jgi:hypothetical protein
VHCPRLIEVAKHDDLVHDYGPAKHLCVKLVLITEAELDDAWSRPVGM